MEIFPFLCSCCRSVQNSHLSSTSGRHRAENTGLSLMYFLRQKILSDWGWVTRWVSERLFLGLEKDPVPQVFPYSSILNSRV